MSPKKCPSTQSTSRAAKLQDKARNEQQKAILLCDVAKHTHVARSRALVATSKKLMDTSEKLRAKTTKQA
jgi:hypothetical protein